MKGGRGNATGWDRGRTEEGRCSGRKLERYISLIESTVRSLLKLLTLAL